MENRKHMSIRIPAPWMRREQEYIWTYATCFFFFRNRPTENRNPYVQTYSCSLNAQGAGIRMDIRIFFFLDIDIRKIDTVTLLRPQTYSCLRHTYVTSNLFCLSVFFAHVYWYFTQIKNTLLQTCCLISIYFATCCLISIFFFLIFFFLDIDIRKIDTVLPYIHLFCNLLPYIHLFFWFSFF